MKEFLVSVLLHLLYFSSIRLGESASEEVKISLKSVVNLDEHISLDQMQDACTLVVFIKSRKVEGSFIFQRPAILFKYSDDVNISSIDTVINKKHVECIILAIIGIDLNFASKDLIKFDEFVKNNFDAVNEILIYPSTTDIHITRKDQDIRLFKKLIQRFRKIRQKNVTVISIRKSYNSEEIKIHKINRIFYCHYENPVCSLKGVSVKVGYANVSPYLHVQNWKEHQDKKIQYPTIYLNKSLEERDFHIIRGVEGQLFHHLVSEYEMMLSFISPPDMNFGTKVGHDNWTGQFGLLERGEVDLVAGMVAGSLIRGQLGIYLAPLYNVKFTLINRKSALQISWKAPFSVFNIGIWMMIFATLFILSVGVWCLEKFCRWIQYLRGNDVNNRLSYVQPSASRKWIKLVDSFSYFLRMLIRQPLMTMEGRTMTATGFIFASWATFIIILNVIYSSNLTARLSVPQRERRINTMQDVWDLKKKIVVWKGGTIDLYLNHASDKYTVLVRNNLQLYSNTFQNYSVTVYDDDQMVSTSEITGFKYRVQTEKSGKVRRVSDYHFSKEPLINVFCSWLASRELQVAPALKTAMLRAQEMGLLTKWFSDRLKVDGERWITPNAKSVQMHSEILQMTLDMGESRLTMNNLKGVFFLWLIGIVIAICSFLLEILLKCRFLSTVNQSKIRLLKSNVPIQYIE